MPKCLDAPSYPRDCYDAMMMGYTTSGSYSIQPNISRPPFIACCDMETDGGGWTIIQRRIDDINFNEKWTHYYNGFGIPCKSQWIGLKKIYALTQQTLVPPQLRIDLTDFDDNKAFAEYRSFLIGNIKNKYSLYVNGYNQNSTAGDSLEESTGLRFTTSDSDNDYSSSNCASGYSAGWWYDKCFNKASLNGPYSSTQSVSSWRGIHWTTWKPYTYSLKAVEMKIRPNTCLA